MPVRPVFSRFNTDRRRQRRRGGDSCPDPSRALLAKPGAVLVIVAPYSLADLAAGVHDTLADSFGVSVLYSRGALSKTITIIPARTATEIGAAPEGQLRTPEKATDWKIKISDLEPEFGDPQRNDKIQITIRQTVQVWSVLRNADLGLPFEFTDHARTWARVHSKLTQLVHTTAQPSAAELFAEAL